jgi:outer membrane protein assembly factor BamB
VALIELDLTAQPDLPLSSPPPAYRLRLPGLLVAVVLAIALGGAAPVTPTLWRYLGVVPAPGGQEAPFQLAGGRVYTVATAGADRVTTAWAVQQPPRRLWTVRFPARVAGPDDVAFGGVDASPAGDVVLLSDGPAITAVDLHTGRVRWRSPTGVLPLAGGRIGVTQTQVFRPGTRYDQESGAPGLLYFSSTGEPHVEPPLRTELRGIDLRTGAALWTVPLPGAINVFAAPGGAAAVLVLTSDRIERLAGDTGTVDRAVTLPKVGGTGPANGDLSDGLIRVRYGDYSFAGHEVAYAADSLARRWQRDVPEVLLDPPNCGGVLCAGPRAALDVIDPATGQAAWRAPADVDLDRQGGYLVEIDSGTGAPIRLVDPATGAVRLRLDGWRAEISGGADQPIVLRRAEPAGRSAFGVVLADRDKLQLLGETDGPISDCTADRSHVVCRGGAGLRIWAYRA